MSIWEDEDCQRIGIDIDIVRLVPHESPNTDIILLGHSMGGILSAEVALMEPYVAGSTRELRHQILGTINFDTPFLGMHPGVIASGLGSLFRPTAGSPRPPSPTDATASQEQRPGSSGVEAASSDTSYFSNSENDSMALLPGQDTSSANLSLSSSLSLPTSDPNYDPPFPNDVRIPQRTGWSNAWHFINKHSDGLARATKSYVTSHLEFGGALADYNALRHRYEKMRELEDRGDGGRVRLVNYYTASTGRPKKVKEVKQEGDQSGEDIGGLDPDVDALSLRDGNQGSVSANPNIILERSGEPSPIDGPLEVDHHALPGETSSVGHSSVLSDSSDVMEHMEPTPLNEKNPNNESHPQDQTTNLCNGSSEDPPTQSLHSSPSHFEHSLPPIPALPAEPKSFVCESDDKGVRRIAEQQYQREVKAYQRSVKDRDKAINDRRKYLEKREKDLAKEREKELKRDEKERLKAEKDEAKRAAKAKAKVEKMNEMSHSSVDGAAVTPTTSTVRGEQGEGECKRPPRDKKFCLLPPKINGRPDSCWVRVFMPGVDEVGAHCGLFFVDGERYEWFVGDVSERIVEWVHSA